MCRDMRACVTLIPTGLPMKETVAEGLRPAAETRYLSGPQQLMTLTRP